MDASKVVTLNWATLKDTITTNLGSDFSNFKFGVKLDTKRILDELNGYDVNADEMTDLAGRVLLNGTIPETMTLKIKGGKGTVTITDYPKKKSNQGKMEHILTPKRLCAIIGASIVMNPKQPSKFGAKACREIKDFFQKEAISIDFDPDEKMYKTFCAVTPNAHMFLEEPKHLAACFMVCMWHAAKGVRSEDRDESIKKIFQLISIKMVSHHSVFTPFVNGFLIHLRVPAEGSANFDIDLVKKIFTY